MAKIFCTEQTYKIIDDTLQLRGGRGYETAASLRARGEAPFPAERALRDARINLIVEGTSEILRLFVAREALDRHLKIAGDVLNSRLSRGKRFVALIKAAAFYTLWYPAQWIAPLFLVWPRFSGLGKLGEHMRFASRNSHKLARTVFHLMLRNGPKLEKRQMQLGRIVDIAMDLFAISASVARAQSRLGKPAEYPNVQDVADLFCREAQARVRESFRALRSNSDSACNRVAKQVLAGQGQWLEKEIVSF